ncbi:leucyl aminopeptidase [Micropruina sonneratiae]|uniref:leucyl aminopeptidase n=1 Tax=Micropruina sonneratiae TaxID=2986940 RepID=UPI002226D6F5|nr:leucyl aminopeptidase [Micropruina sp. KQZ13P-5]MCW3156826.1 leucyl aminopeptidase [Micropruina sp. KQZ13P-5]
MTSFSLPPLTLATSAPGDADVLVVGLAESAGTAVLVGVPDSVEARVADQFGRPLLEVARELGAASKPGTAVALPGVAGSRLVTVGLGEIDVTPEQVRRAAGNGVRAAAALAGDRPLRVAVSLDAVEPEVVKGAAEGALLGSYSFVKVSGTQPKPAIASITVVSNSGRTEARDAVDAARTVAEAVCLARDWVNTPANVLYPETFAEAARTAAKGTRIDVEVLDDKALEKGGFGGILAVGGGSSRAPRLVRFSYAPRGAKAHLALVGKGITFDTGGLNLKPADGMYTMKSDMAGAAAVLAATRAIARLGLKVRVTAYASMAENMPSGTAYRPSDVLTMYGGTTVENVNSDAEGRLVMADALVRAGEDSPDLIIDVATLTGACVVALGERVAGLMASDDTAADAVLDAAESAGEAFWQLPIPDGTRTKLESKVADLRSGGNRAGGALTAAAFLHSFVPDDVPWAHLDVAGPAFNDEGPYDYVPTGGTGMAVRTLVALAQSLQS